jgi:dipeptidyl aminopeptidase/acylaminoacyl peptidase
MRRLTGAGALVALAALLIGVACRPEPPISIDAGPGSGSATGASTRARQPLARIAFVRDGDLFVLNTASGGEVRLTTDGNASRPWWTADGQQLFFEKDSGDKRQTWRSPSGAVPVQVRDGVWSPDGQRVAFSDPAGSTMRGPSTVWAESNGRRAQVSPSEPDATWSPLGWSPGGSRLALSRIHLGPSPVPTYSGPYPGDGALWLVDADGGHPQEVRLPVEWDNAIQNNGWPDAVRWAALGQSLVVWVGPPNPCASCRADGGPIRGVRVSNGSTVALGSSLSPDFLSWLPNDQAVVVEPGGRETYREKHLVRVDAATGERVPLTDDARFADVEPAVSPDGKQIVFARGRAEQDQPPLVSTPLPGVRPSPPPGEAPLELIKSRRVWLIATDSSQARQLTNVADWTDEAPVWTLDGQWIVFVRWQAPVGGQASAELWAIRPDGSDAQRLVTGVQLPRDFHDGFGFYGALGWQQLFAVGPPQSAT